VLTPAETDLKTLSAHRKRSVEPANDSGETQAQSLTSEVNGRDAMDFAATLDRSVRAAMARRRPFSSDDFLGLV